MKLPKSFLLSLLCLLSACSSISDPVVRYYVFDLPELDSISANTKQTIVIDDVILVQHLNTRSIVQQIKPLQISSSNWHLWAMNPSDMLTDNTLSFLQKNLKNIRITKARDSSNHKPIYSIKIQLKRFNGGLQNDAVISGSWQIINIDKTVVKEKFFHITTPLNDDGFSALAHALQSSYQEMLTELNTHILRLTNIND